MQPTLRCLSGAAIEPYLGDLARLRITIFRNFPYLYDGSLSYESVYARNYLASPDSLIVLALVDETVVGASTAIPLAHEDSEFQAPFIAAHDDPATICYGGESLLLPQYRGNGIYRQFFVQRENHARQLKLKTFAFCAVERPDDHPLRPGDYAGLDPLWARYGYTKHPQLIAHVDWKDVDQPASSQKRMVFWLKALSAPGATA